MRKLSGCCSCCLGCLAGSFTWRILFAFALLGLFCAQQRNPAAGQSVVVCTRDQCVCSAGAVSIPLHRSNNSLRVCMFLHPIVWRLKTSTPKINSRPTELQFKLHAHNTHTDIHTRPKIFPLPPTKPF